MIDRILRVQDQSSAPSITSTTTSTGTTTTPGQIIAHPSLDTLASGQPIPTDLTTDVTALRAAREHRETVNTVQTTCQALVETRAISELRVVEHLSPTDVEWADLVVTVGGDGTFIRASHSVDELSTTPLLGVNSSPSSSFGFYTCATSATFGSTLQSVLSGALSPHTLHRMRAYINHQPAAPVVLNEALFSATSPAASSRYILTGGTGATPDSSSTSGGGHRQFQCSSGVWISTAGGSTAAIHSAGGRIQPLGDTRLQYRVRELFKLALPSPATPNVGGYLTDDFVITSRMREAHLFLDGCFHPQSLRFGDRLTFKPTPQPLRYFVTSGGGQRQHERLRLSKQRLGRRGLEDDPNTESDLVVTKSSDS